MRSRLTTIAASALASLALSPASHAAGTFTALYSFCGQTHCPDGNFPAGTLVADAAGNLFGTTALGGANNWGAIFELKAQRGGGYTYKLLHSFCAEANCTDGSDPQSGLVIDTAGNLYGTTKFGGTQNGGTVFELRHRRKLKILHSFCAQGAACSDGSWPMYDGLTYQGAESGTPYDGTSPLYGTTIYGGENDGGYGGTAYSLAPNKKGKKWKETVVWQFCAQTNCADGNMPHNGLVMDSSGNLYGVTFGGGGSSNDGVIFELSPQQGGGWSETVLHDFCGAANCTDGANPQSPLAWDNGNLVGTTSGGGASGGDGVLYVLTPNGTNSQYNVAYTFCSQTNCTDGSNPIGRIAVDSSGDVFGTTLIGGTANGCGGNGCGTIYELTAQGAQSVLHDFCTSGNCSDGNWPQGGVTLDASGDVFGTATEGGSTNNAGTVFELTP